MTHDEGVGTAARDALGGATTAAGGHWWQDDRPMAESPPWGINPPGILVWEVCLLCVWSWCVKSRRSPLFQDPTHLARVCICSHARNGDQTWKGRLSVTSRYQSTSTLFNHLGIVFGGTLTDLDR